MQYFLTDISGYNVVVMQQNQEGLSPPVYTDKSLTIGSVGTLLNVNSNVCTT